LSDICLAPFLFPEPMGSSVRSMRSAFAALLLLLQLQPVLGTAVCLGLMQQPNQAQCEMPEHGAVPSQSLSESAPIPIPNCALASVCVPAPLALPDFANPPGKATVLGTAPAIAGLDLPLDVSSAPPFPPPRV